MSFLKGKKQSHRMSIYNNSTAEHRKVLRVQFGVLNPEEIKQMSVCEVKYPESFELNPKGIPAPKKGGLLDPRMGTIDKGTVCETCNSRDIECPGHFGHIELVQPVFHIGFMPLVMKLLQCVCFHCSKILSDANSGEFRAATKLKNPKKRLKKVHEACKKMTVCNSENDHGGCGNVQPKYKREHTKITAKFENTNEELVEKKRVLTALQVQEVFKHISDTDCRILGMDPEWCRPDWLITSVMPVPPPAVRPSVAAGGGADRAEDDLTHKLAEIVKYNSQLKRQQFNGAPQHILNEFTGLVQNQYISYINNDIPGRNQDTRNGRPIKSIRQRLKGKEGRIRNNLMGKRVDFSARTVITPDPTLEIDQVGVPRSIARNLTYPEIVTPFNIERLKELVRNGPDQYPGAKYLIRKDGNRVDLRYTPKAHEIILNLAQKLKGIYKMMI